jgi:hypothetical protein
MTARRKAAKNFILAKNASSVRQANHGSAGKVNDLAKVNVSTNEKETKWMEQLAKALDVNEWTDLVPIAVREFYERYRMLNAESLSAAFASYVSEKP